MHEQTTRLQSIVLSVCEGYPVVVAGPVPEAFFLALARYGVSARRHDGSPIDADATVVVYRHLSRLLEAARLEFEAAIRGVRNIVVFDAASGDLSRLAVEGKLAARGYRIHPCYFEHVAYDEDQSETFWSVMQRVETAAIRGDGGIGARTDSSRHPGAGTDTRLAAYTLAARAVRPGDAVLDFFCGAGEGANVLRSASQCRSVLGIDFSASVTYAGRHFDQPGLGFRTGDLQHLASLPDASVDVLVAIDILQHMTDTNLFLGRATRLLTPGGRLVAAVPLARTDGRREPGEGGLRAYTKDSLLESLGGRLRIETVHVLSRPNAPGLPGTVWNVPADCEAPEGDWLVVVAFRDPLDGGAQAVPFEDSIYPYPDPTANLLAFGRDYENPWLMRSLFGMSVRNASGPERARLAGRVLATASEGSADAGAAICVLGYAALEGGRAEELASFLDLSGAYVDLEPKTPHALRWKVSLHFLRGCAFQSAGKPEDALACFSAVVSSDWLSFSPTLGTKAAEAAYRAGMIAWNSGRSELAVTFWTAGVAVGKSLFAAPFEEVTGYGDCPLPDPLLEVASALESVRKCGDGLRMRWNPAQRSRHARWAELVDDARLHASLRNARIEAGDDALRDAASWRSLRRRIRKSRLLGPVLRLVKALKTGDMR